MPFNAVGFPQPVYSHLMGSNDGINWDDLKSYNFGWRDASMAFINGEYWITTGTYVNRTTDFETFTQIKCPNMELKNLWASEFFQDNSGQWWFIYCGSETDVDYSEFKLYASKMFPNEYRIDSTRYDISLNAPGGYIDPNINYINGKYYLWCSKTSSQTQELHLFQSDSILGTYNEIDTNIMSLTNSAGYTWNEAPEMLVVGDKYYLYSDPWNKGMDENKRDVYRAESTDLKKWTNMQRCNADCTMRHFTPLRISATKITLWNGNPETLQSTNLNNFEYIQNVIDRINSIANDNPLFSKYDCNLDLSQNEYLNRNARNQFIKNAQKIEKITPKILSDMLRLLGVIDYDKNMPDIPKMLYLDKTIWNTYWQTISDKFNLIESSINQLLGG